MASSTTSRTRGMRTTTVRYSSSMARNRLVPFPSTSTLRVLTRWLRPVTSGFVGHSVVTVMHLAPHWQARLEPGVVGFRSHENMWDLQATRLELPETARRFEPSMMAYGCAIGLAASIRYLLRVGIARIRDHSLRLADLLIDGLRERHAHIVGPQLDEQRTSIVAARFPDYDAVEMARRLNAARVVVSARQSTVRFPPHLYNEPADIERALEEIDHVLR